jgi:ABC-type antimicrobial peptide transport system permease subunit
MALGAAPMNVLAAFLRNAFVVILGGVVLGGPFAMLAAHIFSTFLYGLSPADPITFSGGVAILLLVATVATLIPASRAARVDPLQALRNE